MHQTFLISQIENQSTCGALVLSKWYVCHCRKSLIQKMAEHLFQIFILGKAPCVHLFLFVI
jgi:hypothetical protein